MSIKSWTFLRDKKQLRFAGYLILSLMVPTDLNLLQKDFRLSDKENKVWQLHKILYSLKQAGWQTMTKSMLALEFKQCKSNTSIYYFIDEKTRELVIIIVYVDNIYFMGLKDFLLLLELKQKFKTK